MSTTEEIMGGGATFPSIRKGATLAELEEAARQVEASDMNEHLKAQILDDIRLRIDEATRSRKKGRDDDEPIGSGYAFRGAPIEEVVAKGYKGALFEDGKLVGGSKPARRP